MDDDGETGKSSCERSRHAVGRAAVEASEPARQWHRNESYQSARKPLGGWVFGTSLRNMREVSDAFLLNMAEISAALIGLFLVGVFFYMETGLRRAGPARAVFEPYLRSGTRITFIVFAFPIGLSLALVALEPVWARVLFALLSLILLAANVDSAVRVRGVAKVTGSIALLVNEVVTTIVATAILVTPWALGGLHPTREDLAWAILLSFAAGFLSIGAVVISAFDIARLDAAAPALDDGARTTTDQEPLTEAELVQDEKESGPNKDHETQS